MTNTIDSSTSISQRTRSSRITPLAPHPSIKYESPELEDISIPLDLPTKNENPDIEDIITAGKRRENLSRISRQPTSVIKKEEESNSALKNKNCRPKRVRVPPHGGLILSPKNESPDIEGCNAARKRGKGATQNSRKPALIPKRLRESRSKLKDKSHLVNLPSAERIIQSFRYKSSDIEDAPFPGKIKRDATEACQPSSCVRMTRDSSSNADSEDVKPRKLPQARRQIKNKGPVSVPAPSNWAEIYGIVKEMRTSGSAQNAPVDRMGCERLALPDASPRDRRYQTLTALMLSSQTKDSVNAAAMNRLYFELKPHTEGAPKGLTVENIIAVEPKDLNELINQVGFHNNKTKYMKATAEILRDKWNSDIPDTIEGLKSLPGVGPKMAYLCLSSAWGRTEGIGVDVHVHRITNRWRWQETSTPEETRLALESWLPKEHWHELNSLLVGLGQLICLPIGRKCDQCELSSRGLCPAAK